VRNCDEESKGIKGYLENKEYLTYIKKTGFEIDVYRNETGEEKRERLSYG